MDSAVAASCSESGCRASFTALALAQVSLPLASRSPVPGRRAARSQASHMRFSAETAGIESARATSWVSDLVQPSGRSPWWPPPGSGWSSSRISARSTPSLPAAAHDSRACHWRSRPTNSSLVACGQRHSGPEARSRAVASAAEGGQMSHSPPLAKPARRGSRSPGAETPGAETPGAEGPGAEGGMSRLGCWCPGLPIRPPCSNNWLHELILEYYLDFMIVISRHADLFAIVFAWIKLSFRTFFAFVMEG